MKIFYSTFILMLFTTIMFIGISLKAQIHSTTAGGSWNDPNTWVEEIVPGADDDVVINGPVNTNGNLCNDLTITSNGVLNNTFNDATLYVGGNIINEGTICNYAYYFYLNVGGDITNNGTWTNRITYLTGTELHSLSQNGDAEFSGYEFNVEEGTGQVNVLSDFNFKNTRILLNGGIIELDNSKGANLYIDGSFIVNGSLHANNNEVHLDQGAYFENFNLQDANLNGIIIIKGNNNVFSGNTILTGTLKNDYYEYNLSIYDDFTNNGLINSYGNSFYINMYGNIANNGEIINSSGALYFDIYGNIVNNGTWNNNSIELGGESDQNISCLNENAFEVDDFIDQQPLGLINALTDLYFINTDINLNNDTLLMPNNSTLSILNNYITNSVVYSPDGRITLNMNSSAYINNCKISDVNLNGKIECKNTDFYGEIILNGEMYNEYSAYTVNIDGNITNNGSIHDYANYLNLNVSGDIINNGIWSNRLTYLTGIEPHILSQNGEVEFSGYEFNAEEGTGLISLMSNFNFNNTRVILNGGTMELDNSKGGNLFIHGSFIVNGNLIANNNELYLGQNAYIQDFSVQNSVLRGIIEIRGDNVVFSGNTILTDTLQNDYNNYNLSIFDDFIASLAAK